MRPRLFFRWYDLWVGAYWDRHAGVLYVCPLPTLGVALPLRAPREMSPGRFEVVSTTNDPYVERALDLCEPHAHIADGAQASMTPAAARARGFPHTADCPGCYARKARGLPPVGA